MAARKKSPLKWTEARIERELKLFLIGFDFWPGFRYFESMGRRDLYQAASNYGGIAYWCKRIGVAYDRKPQQTWDDLKVLRLLRHLHIGRGSFLSQGEMEEMGHGALWQQMRSRGGVQRWVELLGIPRIIRQHQRRTSRGPDWIKREYIDQFGHLDYFPSQSDFVIAGRQDLLMAMRRQGGLAHWARIFGKPRVGRVFG